MFNRTVAMAKSDTDDGCESTSIMDQKKMLRVLTESVLDKCNDTTIHSGQFMVSCVHDDGDTDAGSETDGTHEKKVVQQKVGSKSDDAKKEIDASLTKLFNCMTLAYSGNRLTSPKWKNFKGVKLPLKEKIRLNNIIWREWHMQYIKGQLATICQFDPPISDKTHSKPEAVVLEGKYWKRRLECVTAEYQKWRVYYKDRMRRPEENVLVDETSASLFGLANVDRSRLQTPQPVTTMMAPYHDQMMTDDDFIMDLSDTLFTSLNQPFPFPNPKELSQLGNADIIQPGLVQLQPNLDDYMMDTLEPLPPLQEMMSSAAWNKFTNTPAKYISYPTLPASPPLPTGQGNSLSSYMPAVKMELNSLLDSSMYGSLPMMLPSTGTLQNNSSSLVSAASPSSVDVQQLVSMSDTRAPAGPPPPPPPLPGMRPDQLMSPCMPGATSSDMLKSNRMMDLVLPSELNQIPEEPESPLTSPDSQMTTQQQQQRQSTIGADLSSAQTMLGQAAAGMGSPLTDITRQAGINAGSGGGQSQLMGSTGQQSALAAQLNLAGGQSIGQPNQLAGAAAAGGGGDQPTRSDQKAAHITFIQMQLQTLLQSLSQQQQAEAQPASATPPLQQQQPTTIAALASETDRKATLRHGIWSENDLPVLNKRVDSTAELRRASTGSVAGVAAVGKRDGSFLVPQRVGSMKSKPRNIAPAPLTKTTKSAQQNTYLAQLLAPKSALIESYSPAGLNVKTEQSSSSFKPTTFQAAVSQSSVDVPCNASIGSPANVAFTPPSPYGSMNDFQRNVLLAATASQAIGVPGGRHHHHHHVQNVFSSPATKHEPNSPSSPQFHLPTSPIGSDSGSPGRAFRMKTEIEKQVYKVNRRASHTSAEQKRRYNIKSGFDTLHKLVPALTLNVNSKVSKAAKLQKTADYCKKLKQERTQMLEEAELLRREIEVQNNAISMCQSKLPATGVPVTRHRADQMCELLDEYIYNRTRQNWKFWIFSVIIRPLFETFNSLVSTASVEELCRTVLTWLDRHCSLVALRPAVSNSLCHLSTTTAILSDPSRVPEQAAEAVRRDREAAVAAMTGVVQSSVANT